MPLFPRIVLPETLHYIFHQSVRRVDLFEIDEDYQIYLELMSNQGKRNRVHFVAYCLQKTQVHLLAIPYSEEGLSRCIGEAHRMYTKRINERQDVTGYLFQGRFQSCPVDPDRFYEAIQLVEYSPVYSKFCEYAKDFSWSSARFHLGLTNTDPLVEHPNEYPYEIPANWEQILKIPPANFGQLLAHTQVGKPFGSQSFLERVEKITGVSFHINKRGRPKKSVKA